MDNTTHQRPEVPIIIIERDEQPQQKTATNTHIQSGKQKWTRRLVQLVVTGCMMVAVAVAYHYWNYYYNIGVPVSVSPGQNITKLQSPATPETSEVVMTSDSIFGVAMDFYAIHGLYLQGKNHCFFPFAWYNNQIKHRRK